MTFDLSTSELLLQTLMPFVDFYLGRNENRSESMLPLLKPKENQKDFPVQISPEYPNLSRIASQWQSAEGWAAWEQGEMVLCQQHDATASKY